MLLLSTNLTSFMFRHMHQGGGDRVGVRSGGCSQCIVVHAQWYASSHQIRPLASGPPPFAAPAASDFLFIQATIKAYCCNLAL